MEYITFEWNDQKISVLFNRSILHGITNVQVYACRKPIDSPGQCKEPEDNDTYF